MLQIGGKHANFSPVGVTAGSNRQYSPWQEKYILQRNTHTHSAEKGKTPQSELQLGEIITVVRKKYSSSSETNMFLTNTFLQRGEKNPTDTRVNVHMSIRNTFAINILYLHIWIMRHALMTSPTTHVGSVGSV